MKQREISLVDLLVEILLHWRGIVIAMAIGGFLLGAFGYTRSVESAQNQTALVEELREAANVARMDVVFLVTSDDLVKTYSIEKVYEDMLGSAELIEQMARETGISAASLSEVYSLARGFKETLNGSDTFKISIVHGDEAVCRKLAEIVIDYLDRKHDVLEGKMGVHEIAVLDQWVGLVGDAGIRDPQKTALDNIFSAKTMAEKLRAGFSLEELQYCILMVNEEETQSSEAVAAMADVADIPVAAAPKVSLKYVVLGMLLAAVAYAFVIFLRYILDNRLRSTDNLQALYEIPQLGWIPEERGRKKLFGFVDRWFLALRYWNRRRFTREEALNLAVVAVKMAAVKNGLEEICFIGCDMKARALETCQRIRDLLGREDIRVQILDNVLYNAESMEMLGDMKGVVLLEKAGSALYTEIAQELELMKRQEIMVLGGIIVDA